MGTNNHVLTYRLWRSDEVKGLCESACCRIMMSYLPGGKRHIGAALDEQFFQLADPSSEKNYRRNSLSCNIIQSRRRVTRVPVASRSRKSLEKLLFPLILP